MNSKSLVLFAHVFSILSSATLLFIATMDFVQFRQTHNLEQGIEALYGVGLSIWFLGMHFVTKQKSEPKTPEPTKAVRHEEVESRSSGYKCDRCGAILPLNHSEMLNHNCVGHF